MTITFERPVLQAAADWPPCPTWCAGGDSCYGGDTLVFAHGTVTTNRVHQGVLVDVVTDAYDGAAPQRIRVLAERYDTPSGVAGPVSRVLRVEAINRPTHLTDADVAAHLDGVSDEQRNNLLAHFLAGAFATQSAWLTPEAAAAIVAALVGEV